MKIFFWGPILGRGYLGHIREKGGTGRETLAPAAGYIWGGSLRETGRHTLAPAAGYMWGSDLSFASVVLMCRLYLSRWTKEEKERISL